MITVIVPVLNESATVRSVVELAIASPGVTEVIVVDDGSIDGTPELARASGARVITSTLLGKGASMNDGMLAARNEILVYLDGDLSNLERDLIPRLAAPIVEGRADFVKANFSRRAGRVTILTARPLLDAFFPELVDIQQPLGGIIASRRSLLLGMTFELDYGVDVGLLLDALAARARIGQVDIGYLEHSSHSLETLGGMAREVVRTILQRAARQGRLDLARMGEVEEEARHARAEISLFSPSDPPVERLAVFDMDGTLLDGRFAVHLAEETQRVEQLADLLDSDSLDADERSRRIAAVFRGVPREVFEETARRIPLMPGAPDVVVSLRRLGYRVGLVSDSFHSATEVVRRRVFAEFSIGHLMRFRSGIATGEVTLSPAMVLDRGCPDHTRCKGNVVRRLCMHHGIESSNVLAVGDGLPDICMFRAAGLSVAVNPRSVQVQEAAVLTLQGDLLPILSFVAQGA